MLDHTIRLILAVTIVGSAILFLTPTTATVTVITMTVAAIGAGQYAKHRPFG